MRGPDMTTAEGRAGLAARQGEHAHRVVGDDLRHGDTVYVEGEWLVIERPERCLDDGGVIAAFVGNQQVYFAPDGSYSVRR